VGQKLDLDTIYVTYNKTCYLIFNQDFDPGSDFIDVSGTDFQAEIKGEAILIKSVAPMVKPAGFMIKNGEQFYHGHLAYKLHPPINFYDYRSPKEPVFSTLSDSAAVSEDRPGEPLVADGSLTEAMLQAVMSRNPDVHTVGVAKGKIVLSLSNVLVNEEITYLKILLHNKSDKRFDIDFTGFVYSEPATLLDSGKTNGKVMDIQPLLQTNVEIVNAHQRRYLGYALSLPEVSKRSKLVVTIIERNTSNAISFDIPAGALLKTKIF